MAQGVRGVARLLERTQHQVRQDSLLGLPHDFANEALIMLRGDAQFAAGQGDAHSALTAAAIGIGPARLRRRRYAAMPHGNLALAQVFHAERIAERACQLFEFENLAGIGLFVHAMQRFDAALKEIAGDPAVGREHKFFNEAVRDVALAPRYVGHALLFIEFDDRLGQIEVDGAVFIPARVQKQRQFRHGAVGEINRGAAQARFPVENRAGANIMRDVRDVHLKMPAVCSAFDVDGVIEIARGFPVNRYNRQMAKIFAVRAFGLADGFGAKLRFLHDFVREQMRQVMLAYDDFGIYTEFARSTENFDDTAARRGAAAGKTRQLDVDHRAVEFRHARNAAAAEAALIEAARTHFLRKVRRQFVPRRNDDFVLDAGVVGENHVSLRAVTKQTHDRGVRAVQDANDAALGTLGAWDTAPRSEERRVGTEW